LTVGEPLSDESRETVFEVGRHRDDRIYRESRRAGHALRRYRVAVAVGSKPVTT
jgi:hypothetical protein